MRIRTYSELISLPTFEERFEYLKIVGGRERYQFGFDRYLNQDFYRSKEWQMIRNEILARDEWDLGVDGYTLGKHPIIHHMNPITKEDIVNRTEILMSPEYLILCSKETHEAIHKGGFTASDLELMHGSERTPNDTDLWRRGSWRRS